VGISSELRTTGLRFVAYGSSNEICVFSMGRIPITAVKNPHGILVHDRQGLEEADEAMFIVHLSQVVSCSASKEASGNPTFNSGLEDMIKEVYNKVQR